ncbi:uncharacterized protein LOC107159142 [Marmota marmota marmota]|uniref:uncharacterized protein LOC107159142 n=1 Tax=Marmota marmota marmota TaxID=9994 RepID=UPI002092FD71|nr:uncharacterized protein LOC107159142 [Marmota marmota marmota]
MGYCCPHSDRAPLPAPACPGLPWPTPRPEGTLRRPAGRKSWAAVQALQQGLPGRGSLEVPVFQPRLAHPRCPCDSRRWNVDSPDKKREASQGSPGPFRAKRPPTCDPRAGVTSQAPSRGTNVAGPWTRRGPRDTQARPPTEVTARALRPVPRPHSRAATASRNTVSLSKRHGKRIASVPVSGRLASGRECEGVRACRWLVSGGACVGVPVCGCARVRRCVCGCAGVQVGTQAQEEGHELPSAKKCRPKSHCVRCSSSGPLSGLLSVSLKSGRVRCSCLCGPGGYPSRVVFEVLGHCSVPSSWELRLSIPRRTGRRTNPGGLGQGCCSPPSPARLPSVVPRPRTSPHAPASPAASTAT